MTTSTKDIFCGSGLITTLSDLATAAQKHKREKYPNVPAHALPRATYSDKDANGLTRCIVDFINLQPGCYAWRVNNAAVYDVTTGKHRAGTIHKGVADISALRQGRAWQIEVKTAGDRQSDDQKVFEQRVRSAGGVYVIAATFSGFAHYWHSTPTNTNAI